MLIYAVNLEKKAKASTAVAEEKRQVEIDLDAVGDLSNTIYDDISFKCKRLGI